MKLSEKWAILHEKLTIQQVAVRSCASYSSGVAECAADSAEKTSELLGNLIATLHSKGILLDSDVLKLFPGFEVTEE